MPLNQGSKAELIKQVQKAIKGQKPGKLIKGSSQAVKEGTNGYQKKDMRGYELDGAQQSVIKDNILEGDTYQRGGHWNHPFLYRETNAHWRVQEAGVVTTRYRAALEAAAAAEQNTQPPPLEQAEMALVVDDSGIGSLHAHDEKEPTHAIAATPGMRTIAIKSGVLAILHDKVEYVLDKPIDVIPDKESLEFATFDVKAHQKHIDNASDAQCVMLSSMSLELQGQHEHMLPYEMLKHLESFYASQAQTMEYEILRDLFKCKLHDASKVSEHVLKMIGLIERLASIGTVLLANVSTNLILPSLPTSFENFIVNFNMNNTKIGRPELHNRLKTYESSTAKVKSELMVSSSAKTSKWKNKQQ
ncbi:hypothetical protein SASPL_121004 [Salvia splendens]|uniref:Uncharacterized protein n=1 Tax=Salvia splendens TaxID=180675 RepID=A0A8X8ZWT3_SALSN|nr:hypothetical protein SASPL_121004 [Salvia splendens]